ncbi:hypothetical protein B0T26DRAFT_429748 [Lasiosphaeria miniovina]|uniref:Uncharacterized protein n=1 Tax=Lasiosphaeria miniovina TaxID=1954250 RepID=A0AA40A5Z8_9PEZI|nr:uncharacterized protein B0T26DRAFT_429748 [Lasiosphaeria miniovina]KAK0709973.1 hypothetical protein B0T26DRAFT_429748 [Lasiosphaeria miniovina]
MYEKAVTTIWQSPVQLISILVSLGPFVPIREEEAARTARLPPLNFRPLALKNEYLIFLMTWFFLCFSGVAVLVIFGRVQPPWFQFRSDSSYQLWFYAPGIIGFLTTVLWRGTIQSYNRIIPYVRMANLPISYEDQGGLGGEEAYRGFTTEQLNAIPGGTVNIGVVVQLWKRGDYMSVAVNLTPFCTLLLTPLKSSLFQLIQDDSGWNIRVSVGFGVVAMAIYAWLLLVTLSIAIHLRKKRTGLKWNPATLAAQLALIQGSDIFGSFTEIDTTKWRFLNDAIQSWSQGPTKKCLCLGYWKQKQANGQDLIIHGVRFLPRSEDSHSKESKTRSNTSQPGQPLSIQRDQPRHPEVDRIWNPVLRDLYMGIATILGVAFLVAGSVAWGRGFIHETARVEFVKRDVPAAESEKMNHLVQLGRGIVFSLLPSLIFGFFNNNFVAVDVYLRTMTPIHNMAMPLPEPDQERLYPDKRGIKGAAARDSVLLDYVSLDLISCIAQAFDRGHYKIILGTILATLCNSVYLVAGRLFYYTEVEEFAFTVHVNPSNLYAAVAIMIFYCIAIWVLRPTGPVRTCRPVYTLMDLTSLVHASDIVRHPPEFWLQAASDTEAHMVAQATLANRVYRFGIYEGTDTREHVGIAVAETPDSWRISRAAETRVDADDTVIPKLNRSIGLMKEALYFGVIPSPFSPSDNAENEQPQHQLGTGTCVERVRSVRYRSWRRRVRRSSSHRAADNDDAESGRGSPGQNGSVRSGRDVAPVVAAPTPEPVPQPAPAQGGDGEH